MKFIHLTTALLFTVCATVALPIERDNSSGISIQFPTASSSFVLGDNLTILWNVHTAVPWIDVNAISSNTRVIIAEKLNGTLENYTWTIPNELIKGDNASCFIEIAFPTNQSVLSEPFVVVKTVSPTTTVSLSHGIAEYTAVASITIIGQEGMVHAQSSTASSVLPSSLALFISVITASFLL